MQLVVRSINGDRRLVDVDEKSTIGDMKTVMANGTTNRAVEGGSRGLRVIHNGRL